MPRFTSRVLQPKVFPQQTFMSAAIFPFKFNTVKWNEATWNNLYIPVQQAFPRPHCAASLISSHLLRQDRKDLQFLLHFPTLFPILCAIFSLQIILIVSTGGGKKRKKETGTPCIVSIVIKYEKKRICKKTAEFPVLRKRTWLQTDTFYLEQHLPLNCQSVRKSCVHFCQWINVERSAFPTCWKSKSWKLQFHRVTKKKEKGKSLLHTRKVMQDQGRLLLLVLTLFFALKEIKQNISKGRNSEELKQVCELVRESRNSSLLCNPPNDVWFYKQLSSSTFFALSTCMLSP